MKIVNSVFKVMAAIIIAILGAVMWVALKTVSLVFYIMSFVLAAASVLIGGIGKFIGIVSFIVTAVMFAINGFSIEILAMCGMTVALVTSKLWLEKLAFACSNISAAL